MSKIINCGSLARKIDSFIWLFHTYTPSQLQSQTHMHNNWLRPEKASGVECSISKDKRWSGKGQKINIVHFWGISKSRNISFSGLRFFNPLFTSAVFFFTSSRSLSLSHYICCALCLSISFITFIPQSQSKFRFL